MPVREGDLWILWSEDDAGTPDRERVDDAWQRIFQENRTAQKVIATRNDPGDTFEHHYAGGRLAICSCGLWSIALDHKSQLTPFEDTPTQILEGAAHTIGAARLGTLTDAELVRELLTWGVVLDYRTPIHKVRQQLQHIHGWRTLALLNSTPVLPAMSPCMLTGYIRRTMQTFGAPPHAVDDALREIRRTIEAVAGGATIEELG
jgi:hypothetical protein